jgi:tetratricopeptide (TPR) repeat protein
MMKIRSTGASLALIAGLGLVLAGCGKLNEVRAMKEFKDGNKQYAGSHWKEAADKYEAAIRLDPDAQVDTCGSGGPGCVYFYLANSYDNMYRPTRKGEPANDQLLEKAIANYKLAAEKIQDPLFKTRSLQYLVQAYGPDKLNDPTLAEPVVKNMIELDPKDPGNYFALASIYENSGEYELAEQTLLQAKEAKPNDPGVYLQLAAYYNRQGDFDKTIEALNERIRVEPNNPEAYHTLSTYYWDEAYRDIRLNDKQKLDYVMSGIQAVDKAIEIRPDYMEAIAYKNLLLRLQANLEKDPAKQQQLLREADQLRDKATELRKQKAAGVS